MPLSNFVARHPKWIFRGMLVAIVMAFALATWAFLSARNSDQARLEERAEQRRLVDLLICNAINDRAIAGTRQALEAMEGAILALSRAQGDPVTKEEETRLHAIFQPAYDKLKPVKCETLQLPPPPG